MYNGIPGYGKFHTFYFFYFWDLPLVYSLYGLLDIYCLFSMPYNKLTEIDIFSWRKLESKSDEAKKLVDQYWKWEGTDEKGRKFNQGKIFK